MLFADQERRLSKGNRAHILQSSVAKVRMKGNAMTWTTPILVEICMGLEINGYLPAEI
jgi:coenzyme PQQ precursor peptide PqqA